MIESKIYYPAETSINLYHVGKSKWSTWNTEARKTFNHLYGTTVENKPIMASTDIFGENRQTRKVLHAVMWNMAWEAADYINKSK